MTRYRTIVADPPWEVGDFPANFGYAAGKACPYPTNAVVPQLAEWVGWRIVEYEAGRVVA